MLLQITLSLTYTILGLLLTLLVLLVLAKSLLGM